VVARGERNHLLECPLCRRCNSFGEKINDHRLKHPNFEACLGCFAVFYIGNDILFRTLFAAVHSYGLRGWVAFQSRGRSHKLPLPILYISTVLDTI